MALASDFTLLKLDPLVLPPYAVRGITQSLTPIAASTNLRRTINGTLISVSDDTFAKYESTIRCTDGQHPPLDGVFSGLQLTVDCVCELAYEDTTAAAPARTIVPGSSRSEDGLVFYRPRLTMLVRDWRIDYDEWGAKVGWTLSLEEA